MSFTVDLFCAGHYTSINFPVLASPLHHKEPLFTDVETGSEPDLSDGKARALFSAYGQYMRPTSDPLSEATIWPESIVLSLDHVF